jgi:peptidoglycan/xylan/chitin deacetylase (PgdA/CDA1 family)
MLRPGGRAVILLYHRVVEELVDPYALAVAPRRFEEHLQVIRELGQPTRLVDLARGVRNGRVADRALCVTFDDGYVDNLSVAKPLLERYDVPATVFVTTGPAGRDREFWWDELERAFLEPIQRSDRLELEIGGRRRTWEIVSPGANPPGTGPAGTKWHLHDKTVPTARHRAFREVYDLVQPLSEPERRRVLDRLMEWAGVGAQGVRPSRRALDAAGVAELARGGLIDVGAHTVNHPALPSQAPSVQYEEIARSKAEIETWLGTGAPVAGFAYPYGQHDDASVGAARDAGFLYACSGEYRPTRKGSDPYLLPRIEVRDVDGDGLAERLRWALALP